MSNQQRAFACLDRLRTLPLKTLREIPRIIGLSGKSQLVHYTNISQLKKAQLVAEITRFVRCNADNLDMRGPVHWGYASRLKRFADYVDDAAPMLYFMHVDYEEFCAETYKAVELDCPDGTVMRFETGDPIADFAAANTAAHTLGVGNHETAKRLHYYNSMNEFISDSLFYLVSAQDQNNFVVLRLTTQEERKAEILEWVNDKADPLYAQCVVEKIAHASIEIAWAHERGLLTGEEADELCLLPV